MKKHLYFILCVVILCGNTSYAQVFSYTGAIQYYTVPAGVTAIAIDAQGAGGGNNSDPIGFPSRPGMGARVQATLAVTPGDVLNLFVGGTGGNATTSSGGIGGYNGGAAGEYYLGTFAGGGGGGASDIRIIGTTYTDRILSAAGGGGAGMDGTGIDIERGGDGGGTTGEDGLGGASGGGFGGTPSAGGAGGSCGSCFGSAGFAGALGVGGAAGPGTTGGGGGGGYYGGGGGQVGGGGGGSSYTDPVLFTSVTHTRGFTSGNGSITITCLPPAPGTVTGASGVCLAGTTTYTVTGGASGGVWTSSAPGIADVGSSSGIVSGMAVGTADITYTVTNSCGSAFSFAPITVEITPTVSATSGASSVCEAASTLLTNATPGGTWSATNTNATVSGGGIVTGFAGGVDTIIYSVTNSCGTVTSSHVVTIDPLPVVSAISGPSTVCVAASVTLTDATPGGIWSVTNANATISSGGLLTGVTVGVDTVLYIVVNSCGATTVSHVVTVDPLPVAGTISGSTTVCPAASITLTASLPGGTWSATNANATVSGAGVVTGVTLGVDTIQYTMTNGCGFDVASHVVTVTLTPSAGTISGPTNVCVGSLITLFNPEPFGVWTATNANATVSSSGDVTGVTAGVDTIQYTVTFSCATATSTFVVTVDPLAFAGVISGPTSVCVGSSITLSSTVTGGAWVAYNPMATVDISTGVVIGVTAGVDTILYNVGTSCGSHAVDYIITVLPLPDSGVITGSTSVCVGSMITLSNASPGGVWTSGTSNASITGGGVVTGASAGPGMISYTVTNSCGVAVAVYSMTVNPLPFAGTISGPSAVCELANITLTDLAPGGVWGVTTSSASVLLGVVTGVTAGPDTILYTVTNSCGTAIATYPIVVNPLPQAGVITGSSTVCVGASITLADTATGGLWAATNTRASVSPFGVVTGAATGLDTIMYTITNSCGAATATYTVNVIDIPVVAAISGPSAVCVGANITLSDATAGGVWSKSNSSANVTSGGVVTGVSTGLVNISYTLTNTCGTVSVIKTVSVDAVPSAGTISGLSSICPAELTTLISTMPGGIWTISNGNALIDMTGVMAGVTEGTSVVTYTVTNHCGTASTTFTVTIKSLTDCDYTSVNPVTGDDVSLKLYPNPNSGTFNLMLTSGVDETAVVIVTDIVGKRITSFVANTNKQSEVALKVPAGIYFVNTITAHGRNVAKVVVE